MATVGIKGLKIGEKEDYVCPPEGGGKIR